MLIAFLNGSALNETDKQFGESELVGVTIFDLEFTAWEGSMARHWLGPGEFKEVVQIGAVKLDSENLQIIDAWNVFVRPRINCVLSPYFEKLTGITNADIEKSGLDFADAYARFIEFVHDTASASFGDDRAVLEDNIRLYGLQRVKTLCPFYDIRQWFAALGLDLRGMHSCDVAPSLGIAFEGRAHNALDDARSIAASMGVMVARGAKLALAA